MGVVMSICEMNRTTLSRHKILIVENKCSPLHRDVILLPKIKDRRRGMFFFHEEDDLD
jgi:hypothetical protein